MRPCAASIKDFRDSSEIITGQDETSAGKAPRLNSLEVREEAEHLTALPIYVHDRTALV